MKEKFLPIGTVILVKKSTKPLMIIGFAVSPGNDKSVIYDYCGVMYPEGLLNSEQNIFFNHDVIEKILYMGYESELDVQFKQKLNAYIKESNNAK